MTIWSFLSSRETFNSKRVVVKVSFTKGRKLKNSPTHTQKKTARKKRVFLLNHIPPPTFSSRTANDSSSPFFS